MNSEILVAAGGGYGDRQGDYYSAPAGSDKQFAKLEDGDKELLF